MTEAVSPGDPFAAPGPRWYTIAAHRPFLLDLASVLHATQTASGPEALADATVLTPTRRGARALAEAFYTAAGGKPVLLPRIRALGDLDEGEPPFEPAGLALDLPPAVSALRRRFELARLIVEQGGLKRELAAAQALELADALGAFLDSLHIEERFEPEAVDRLVEGDLARHWIRSAEFLSVATRAWPARLAELGLVDPVERRVRLLQLLAEQWAAHPPREPLIAAGSTGTGPATARLLGVIAAAPKGCVVLPGLDLDLAEDAWEQVGEQHPQGALARLLAVHGLNRAAVRPWPAVEDARSTRRGRARRRVINEALRPAEATADWLAQIRNLRAEDASGDPIAEGLDGLSLVAAKGEPEAATVIALLLREALETPGKTCALITPDAALGRRVSAELTRWGVEADSSAGSPLAGFPQGVLLGLIARATVEPMRPAGLLGLLKHPLARLGREEAELIRARETLERYALRGPRPSDWTAIERRLEAAAKIEDRRPAIEAAKALARDLRAALESARVFETGDSDASAAARGLAEAAEALARGPEGGTGGLWAGPAGEAAARLLSDLAAEGRALPPATAAGFEGLVSSLLEGETLRPAAQGHPRLAILGALEARLVRADRLVLAGLEEGVWPQGAPIDPFLSRPMRERLGLPPPERRIGLSAHDFAQAACAPEVVLVHCQKRGGQPAVPSRWLWRLKTLTEGAHVPIAGRPDASAWAHGLDAPRAGPPAFARRPEPRPPVEARPTGLSVTGVERWVRDPYAIYARYILKLRPLDRADAPAEAAARGRAVHKALELLVRQHPEALPDDVETLVERLLLDSLVEEAFGEAALARERPLARNAARFVADFERGRRKPGLAILVEQTGELVVDGFTLGARADRIEVLAGQGVVLDFKTGMPPSAKMVEAGFAPQLTLTAAILKAGGFADAGPASPSALTYVRLTGRRVPGEVQHRGEGPEAETLADEALEGLRARIARFADPDTPYVSWAAPQFLKEYGGDYDHLARVGEWGVLAGDGEEGGG